MIVTNPCDWVIERLRSGTPFFTTRINDGEMIQMFRTRDEGALLGTDANLAYVHRECGDALVGMLVQVCVDSRVENILVGHCCYDDPNHELNKMFMGSGFGSLLRFQHEAGGHWPLDGVVDGSTIRMLDAVRESLKAVLVTSHPLRDASLCLYAPTVMVSRQDSWNGREDVYDDCRTYAEDGAIFVWAAGGGLKPTAWRLFREFPQSSHLDVGHLFNGALGLRDYGWLQRGDGPWHEAYFRDFAPYVQKFTGGKR